MLITSGANAVNYHGNVVLNKSVGKVDIKLNFGGQAKNLVALLAMKMRMNIVIVKRFPAKRVLCCVVLQNNPMNGAHLFQRFERAIKCNPIKKVGKRSFYFLLRHCRFTIE